MKILNLNLNMPLFPTTAKREFLRIASTHVDILTVDKRALYIMAIEVASAIDGQISEDGKQSWLSVEEFKEYHKGCSFTDL